MSTYSTNLRVELISTGTQAGTWGTTTNDNLSTVLEQGIAGFVSVSVIASSQALTYLNGPTSTAAANQSVRAALELTTTTSAAFAVYAPPVSKLYVIRNSSAYTATIYNSTVIGNTTAAGTGVAIPAGETMAVWSDGTNFTQQTTYFNSPTFVTPILGTPSSGSLQNCTNIPVAQATGTLPVANGGTGSTSLTANSLVVGNGTSAVALIAPGTSGNILTSNGTAWASTAPGPASSVATTNFTIQESGGKLIFKYGLTTIASLSSTGVFTTLSNVTGGGTP